MQMQNGIFYVSSLPPFGHFFLLVCVFFNLFFILFISKSLHKEQHNKTNKQKKSSKAYPEQENVQDDAHPTFWYQHFQSLK